MDRHSVRLSFLLLTKMSGVTDSYFKNQLFLFSSFVLYNGIFWSSFSFLLPYHTYTSLFFGPHRDGFCLLMFFFCLCIIRRDKYSLWKNTSFFVIFCRTCFILIEWNGSILCSSYCFSSSLLSCLKCMMYV